MYSRFRIKRISKASSPVISRFSGILPLALSVLVAFAPQALSATKFEQYSADAEAAYQNKNYPEAQKNFELAVKEGDKLEKSDKRIATTVYNLALVFQAQGNYAEAEKNMLKAIDLINYLYGPEHQRAGQAYMDLGDLYVEQSSQEGKKELKGKAAESYKKGIDIFEKLYAQSASNEQETKPDEGKDAGGKGKETGKKSETKAATSQETAADLSNAIRVLADFYAEDELYAPAEPLYKRSLELEEFAAGSPDDKDLSRHKAKLAEFYCVQGKYKPAEPLFKDALSASDKVNGPDSVESAHICYNYGGLFYDQGSFGEAELMFKRALKTFDAQAEKDEQDLAQKSMALADVLDRQGKSDEAHSVYKKTLATMEKGDRTVLIRGLKAYQQHLIMQNNRDEAGKIANRIKDLRAQSKQQ